MNFGKIVFAQIMQFVPRREFNDIDAKYKGNSINNVPKDDSQLDLFRELKS